MKLKEALKESWKLTKSNFILMMTVLSVGVFLSVLSITPFVGEPGKVVDFMMGWGRIAVSTLMSFWMMITIQVAFFAVSGQGLNGLSTRQAWKNIAGGVAVMLVYQLIAMMFSIISIHFIVSGVLPVWYIATLCVCSLITIFVAFRLSFFVYYMFGYNQSLWSAIKSSWKLTARKWASLLGLYLSGYLLFVVGFLALIIGSFVAVIFYMFLVIVYFKDWTKEESLIQNK